MKFRHGSAKPRVWEVLLSQDGPRSEHGLAHHQTLAVLTHGVGQECVYPACAEEHDLANSPASAVRFLFRGVTLLVKEVHPRVVLAILRVVPIVITEQAAGVEVLKRDVWAGIAFGRQIPWTLFLRFEVREQVAEPPLSLCRG